MKNIILASGSPRRKELLALAGVDFTVLTADTDETVPSELSPEETVLTLSERKALAVAALKKDSIIIGADTVVAIDNRILGKPKTYDEAFSMLSSLSGKNHFVYTGVCITDSEKQICFCEKTEVEFYTLSKDEIHNYILTGDCFDKAGGYGIQSKGCTLVKKINGDYFNVVGLPIAKAVRALNEFE